jgi:hypothetical protein
MFSMSHHTTIITTKERKNNNITNFHNILKIIVNCEELMLKLMFIHKLRFILKSLQKTFKFHFKYDLD